MVMLKLLLSVLFLGLFGPASPQLSPPARPPLWQVSDGDTTVYLFGSIHALPGHYMWFDGPVRRAFLASDTIVLELPPGQDRAALAAAATYGTLPTGQTLTDLLGPQDAATLHQRLSDAGMPANMLDRYAPWRASLILSVEPLARAGYSPRYGVENVLTRQARFHHKPVIGLESAAFQFSRFAAIPTDQQLAMLRRVLAHPDAPRVQLDRTRSFWASGNVPAIDWEIAKDLKTSPKAMQKLLINARNQDWSRRIVARMARPGRLFIAVGLGHLTGENSVIDRLRAHGLNVKRLQ